MPDSSAAASPVFIVGAERSGSTLLRVMLDGHHDIACIGQFEYSVDAYGPAGAPSMAAYLEMLETDRVFQLHDLTIDETLDVPALVRSFLEQDRVRQGATVPMGVVHRNFEYLPAIFPDARYIHLIRDPRDVARSAIGMGWAADTWHGVEPWIHAEEQWDELVADLDDDQWMGVRYEDLVSDHVATLEALCAFVGVTPSLDELLSYADETDYSHPDASLANQWVKRASDDDVRFVELRVGAVMAGRGYEPSGRAGRVRAGPAHGGEQAQDLPGPSEVPRSAARGGDDGRLPSRVTAPAGHGGSTQQRDREQQTQALVA